MRIKHLAPLAFMLLVLAACLPVPLFVSTVPQAQEVQPPPAILAVDDQEQVAGVGTFCWPQTAGSTLCADAIGVPTAQEPLLVDTPFTGRLRLPLEEPPRDLILSVSRVAPEDELAEAGRGLRWWQLDESMRMTLPLESTPEFVLRREEGLYVLNVFAAWDGGRDVSYGFLIQVDPGCS